MSNHFNLVLTTSEYWRIRFFTIIVCHCHWGPVTSTYQFALKYDHKYIMILMYCLFYGSYDIQSTSDFNFSSKNDKCNHLNNVPCSLIWSHIIRNAFFKGCGMGPWLVLVSPCFRENVVATCKIGSFLCSLDNLLQKNVIVLFFGNQISKWRSFEKRAIFDLLFTFFSHQGKVTKLPSAHISITYMHVFCSPYWLFFALPILKNTNLSGTVSLWYESWCWFLFTPF